MDDIVVLIRQIISDNSFMTIATSDGNIPWVSPVFFAMDENHTFFWHSGKDTKHSRIIAKNPEISVVIFNSRNAEVPGLYMRGQAMEAEEGELQHGLEILFDKAVLYQDKKEELLSHPEDFQGEGRLRLYKFVPEKFFLSNSEKWNGKWIDWTEEAKFQE